MITQEQIKQAKILIVDDVAENIQLLEYFLRSDGYTHVYTTTNPYQVLPLYDEHRFDLLILDLKMPHLNGFELMKQIKEKFMDTWIPIIVVTASYDLVSKRQASSLGAREFISKPIDYEETLNHVRNIIETKLIQVELEQENSVLEMQLQHHTKELQQQQVDMIQALSRAAEYKDHETGNHIIRMANFSFFIAREYGLSIEECKLILQASPMHDVGKIGIPDHILGKPGKLTTDEFSVMKTHTTIGHSILSGFHSPMLQLAADIALYHHEKWDGTGYPLKLVENEIPVSARIIAIADVFDALTSTRPYKKAWSNHDALEYMREQSGKHFDPILFNIFTKLIPSFEHIQQQHAN